MSAGPGERSGPPPVPRWIGWALRHLLEPREVRLVLDELAELHEALAHRHGRREADHRWRRQLRQYPFRLAAGRLQALLSSSGPGAGEVSRAVRSLLRAPAFTTTVVLTVGLGIGGCATIFSLVDALWLRPLPYANADRLVRIYTDAPPNRFPFSVVDFQALQEQQTSFDQLVAVSRNGRALTTQDGVELIRAWEATPGLLSTWGLPLVRGREPGPADGAPGAPGTAMVTMGFAERYLGVSDPTAALGRSVTLDDESYQVIGILPPSLGPLAAEAGIVPTLRLEPPTRKGPFFLQVYGRLRPGVDPQVASGELRALNQRLFPLWADSYQDQNASWGMASARSWARGDMGPLLAVLMAAVGMVLLIALTNAANLLLARLGAREREISVRSALGASRTRIWSHLWVESAVLAAAGAALGLALAQGGVAVLPRVASQWLPRAGEASLGANTVLFVAALAGAATVVFALVPALQRSRRDLASTLRAGGRGSSASRSRQRTQRLLVAGQLAVVMPLLCAASLLVGSLARLTRTNPGFDVEHTLTMGLMLSPASYPEEADQEDFWRVALERVRALPGVADATISSERPPQNVNDVNNFDLEDRPTAPGESQRLAAWIVVDRKFFDALDIPLLEGRSFEETDLEDDAPPVAVVDEAWVRRNYPGESPVGRRFYSGGQTTGPRTTVIGVVGTVPYMGVGNEDLGAVYQATPDRFSAAWLMVRTSGDPADLAGPVHDALRRLDPGVPVLLTATGDELFADALARPRHLSLLLAVFSVIALALAVVGIYGITSYSVQQRRGDIAVRLALGGAPASVLRRTMWEGVRLSVIGLAVGLVTALALTGALSGMLFGVQPRDPASLAAAATLLLVVSAAASLVPALRAVRTDPASTLREE